MVRAVAGGDTRQGPAGPPVELLARCLRGIEWLCAAELRGRFGAEVQRVEHRLVECVAPLGAGLLSAGTVDDIFLLALRLEGVGHQRSALDEVAAQVEQVDTGTLVAAVQALRTLPPQAPFEVVASFLGRRNYNRFEIERAVGEALERTAARRFLPGPGASEQHPPLSWRVHLVGSTGFLGLRLSGAPLHRRPYKLNSREGTLHPPLAYAGALLGAPTPGALVLDPFCGAGTILLEAGHHQPAARLLGGDIALEALGAARANAARSGHHAAWMVCDAGRLALSAGSADLIITNPPWRRRLKPAASLRAGLRSFWREAARVMVPDGRIVAILEELEDHKDSIRAAGLEPALLQRVAVSGAWTTLGLAVRNGRRQAELHRLAADGLRAPAEAIAHPA